MDLTAQLPVLKKTPQVQRVRPEAEITDMFSSVVFEIRTKAAGNHLQHQYSGQEGKGICHKTHAG